MFIPLAEIPRLLEYISAPIFDPVARIAFCGDSTLKPFTKPKDESAILFE